MTQRALVEPGMSLSHPRLGFSETSAPGEMNSVHRASSMARLTLSITVSGEVRITATHGFCETEFFVVEREKRGGSFFWLDAKFGDLLATISIKNPKKNISQSKQQFQAIKNKQKIAGLDFSTNFIVRL
jgi:hypothetical protein